MSSCKRRYKSFTKIRENIFATPDAKETDVPCAFCGLSIDNELLYGKFIRKSGLNLHYFCMLFSSGLPQRGDPDSKGILGFFTTDIRKELNRGKKLKCYYCGRNGSTIGCSAKKCQKKFHLPCGLQSNSLHQFYENYPSYCELHRPTQSGSVHDAANTHCTICLGPIEERSSHHTLSSTCCRNAWFHRLCIQRMAMSAGYFFKCPLCNNKTDFVMEMLTCGIYIPEQDAAWELEQNAFQELLHRHNRCDVKCWCPDGREYNKENSRWQVVLCALCGSQGCHIECGRLPHYKPYWECTVCRKVTAKKQTAEENNAKNRSTIGTRRKPRGNKNPTVINDMSSTEDIIVAIESPASEWSILQRSVPHESETETDSDVVHMVNRSSNRRKLKRRRVIVSDDSDLEVSFMVTVAVPMERTDKAGSVESGDDMHSNNGDTNSSSSEEEECSSQNCSSRMTRSVYRAMKLSSSRN